MDDLTVLITGSGAPGIKGTLFSIHHNFEKRKIRTIGTDIDPNAVGKFLCDAFYQIPRATSEDYLDEVLSICEREKVDLFLPQNTAELTILAENKKRFSSIGTEIIVSDPATIESANNKHLLMTISQNLNIPTPDFYLADNFEELVTYASILGWPGNPVVVKPPVSNGMRGVRIIDETKDLKELFYNEKPSTLFTKMNNLKEILTDVFPPLLIMEYLPGDEYTVDVLQSEKMTIIPRKRLKIQSGITFHGIIEKNEDIITFSKKLTEKIKLQYAFGYQFKLDSNGIPKIIESNPRIQGSMVLSTLAGANVIYGAMKQALNETVPDFSINWNTQLIRYWGGVGISNSGIVDII